MLTARAAAPILPPQVSSADPAGGAGGSGPNSGPKSSPKEPSAAPPRSAGSSTLDPLIGRVVLGRYEILQRIGIGGMGAVYVGRQRPVDRKVALKVLRADLMSNEHVKQRFRREAEIIGSLRHPNTIQLIDYGESDDGMSVMVMELLVGQALNERLKTGGPLGVLEAMRVGEEVAASLAEAHLVGLVHRDLKPANIFLAEVGRQSHAKVLDFGIARLMDEEATRLTSTGQVFGTPRYMSPEQATSTADVDARSDLYSLGLIIYECVVGQPPFVAQTSIQYLSAHTTQPPPKLRQAQPEAPEALEALIDACLAKDPLARPQSAEAVAEALSSIRRTLEAGGTPALPMFGAGTSRPRTHTAEIPDPTARVGPPRSGGERPTEVAAKVPQVTPRPGGGGGRLRSAGGPFGGGGALGRGGAGRGRRPPPPVPVVEGLAVVTPPDPVKPLDPTAPGDPKAPVDPKEPVDPTAPGDPQEPGKTLPLDADPDAGVAQDPEPPPEEPVEPEKPVKPVRPSKNKPPTKQKPADGTPPGTGVVTGPAGMVIHMEDETDDTVARAASCKTSVYAGLGKLTTVGCPKDCAIIVDAACAGRTPAEDRALPPGRRNISVVCEKATVRTAMIQVSEDGTTRFACR